MERMFPRLKDVLPITNGVFSHMNYSFRAEVSKEQLDFLLMSSFAQRNPSPVVDMMHDEDEVFNQLTDAQLTTLAALMLSYYKVRWDKLGDIYDIEYNPIWNYLDQWEDEADDSRSGSETLDSERTDTLGTEMSITNTRTDDLEELQTRNLAKENTRTDNLSESISNQRTDNLTESKSGTRTDNLTETETKNLANTSTRTDNLTETNTGTQGTSGTDSNTHSLWGFNSAAAVNADADSGSNSSTRTDNLTKNNTGTQGISGSETGTDTVQNTGTQQNSEQTTNTGTQSNSGSKTNTGTQEDSGTETGTVTVANSGTRTDVGSQATTGTNTRETDESRSSSETGHRERSGRHFGNIGNLTSQKMIKEEIELWKWNYVQTILEDARDFLTLSVYL